MAIHGREIHTQGKAQTETDTDVQVFSNLRFPPGWLRAYAPAVVNKQSSEESAQFSSYAFAAICKKIK